MSAPLSSPHPPGAVAPLDLFGAAASILRHSRLVVGMPAAMMVGLLAWGLLAPRHYTVSVAFVPSSQSSTVSQLVGLAAQFGLTGGGGSGGDASDSPDFYSDFIKSDELLQAVARQQYRFHESGTEVTGDLMRAFRIDSGPAGLMAEKAGNELLNNHLSVNVAVKTGVVGLSVWTRDPELSVQIIQRILDEVNRFNRQVRQNQAGQERQFIGTRVDSALVSLRAAQDRMQAFLQRNRDYTNSPPLQFEHDRILQDITTEQTLYGSLLQSYEQARMEEVRTTPVVTVVEAPIAPARPDSRRLVLRGLLIGTFGLLLSIVAAVGLDGLARRREESPVEASEVHDLWEARRDAVKALIRRLRRRS